MVQNVWSYNETLVAFNAFCKIPFKDSNKNHPLVVEYAQLIGRSPSALNMKIGNIGRLDPTLRAAGIVGLAHGAKMEQKIWAEFEQNAEQLILKSEMLLQQLRHKEEYSEIWPNAHEGATEQMVLVKQRIGQSFFRTTVLNAYHHTCCISGIQDTRLLEACHISDWKTDAKNRMNPSNGICMNVFFHRAYDHYLIGITPDYHVEMSPQLLAATDDANFLGYLQSIDGRKMRIPDKFLPNRDLLAAHYDTFKAQQ